MGPRVEGPLGSALGKHRYCADQPTRVSEVGAGLALFFQKSKRRAFMALVLLLVNGRVAPEPGTPGSAAPRPTPTRWAQPFLKAAGASF